jgi:hypothetical protein
MIVRLNDLTNTPHRPGQQVLLVESNEWTLAVTCNGQGTYWVHQVDVLNEDNRRSQTARSLIEARDVARDWARQGMGRLTEGAKK